MAENRILVMKNPVKDYAWGSRTAIPGLTGARNPGQKPRAELWMGAHVTAPSLVEKDGKEVPLPDLIRGDPVGMLGREVAETFDDKLPFLLKVLAAAEPLSIQAHPNLEQAREGFRADNDAGIELTAFNRSYKDDNHKPELICALTPFWALKGFRKIESMLHILEQIRSAALEDELDAFKKSPDRSGLRQFYSTLMHLEKEKRERVVRDAVRFASRGDSGKPIHAWIRALNEHYPGDIGVLSPIILNLVELQPGEALYLPSGELHAYLEGVGIEIMANSDNVLRGGCTPKFINVPELLKNLTFEAGDLKRAAPEKRSPVERVYPTPAVEFRLSVISVGEPMTFERRDNRGVEVALCVEGAAEVLDVETGMTAPLKKGSSVMIPGSVRDYEMKGNAVIYKAAVPVQAL